MRILILDWWDSPVSAVQTITITNLCEVAAVWSLQEARPYNLIDIDKVSVGDIGVWQCTFKKKTICFESIINWIYNIPVLEYSCAINSQLNLQQVYLRFFIFSRDIKRCLLNFNLIHNMGSLVHFNKLMSVLCSRLWHVEESEVFSNAMFWEINQGLITEFLLTAPRRNGAIRKSVSLQEPITRMKQMLVKLPSQSLQI